MGSTDYIEESFSQTQLDTEPFHKSLISLNLMELYGMHTGKVCEGRGHQPVSERKKRYWKAFRKVHENLSVIETETWAFCPSK